MMIVKMTVQRHTSKHNTVMSRKKLLVKRSNAKEREELIGW